MTNSKPNIGTLVAALPIETNPSGFVTKTFNRNYISNTQLSGVHDLIVTVTGEKNIRSIKFVRGSSNYDGYADVSAITANESYNAKLIETYKDTPYRETRSNIYKNVSGEAMVAGYKKVALESGADTVKLNYYSGNENPKIEIWEYNGDASVKAASSGGKYSLVDRESGVQVGSKVTEITLPQSNKGFTDAEFELSSVLSPGEYGIYFIVDDGAVSISSFAFSNKYVINVTGDPVESVSLSVAKSSLPANLNSFKLLGVVYDSNDVMHNVAVGDVPVDAEGETVTANLPINISNLAVGDYTLRVLVWKGFDKCEPLTVAREFSLSVSSNN